MSTRICPNCGAEIPSDASFCPKCGISLADTTSTQSPSVGTGQPVVQPQVQRKDPILAAILSLILAGLGQIYVGATRRGIIYLIITIVLYVIFFPAGLIFAIYTIYDAYKLAKFYNEMGAIPQSIFGGY